ncbi:cation diffusion facilitator family transporter [Nitrosococcus oceani]|uniref:Cation-efflux pump FieF n=2 Tax=Nitrosococcus oceani TaxID=1229 RepID=Q3J779_NITOC|nr:cation diffusion facilitator family transporter [Nitrosococcus oceani]KFI18345.1 ferrous iron transporter [Nitrosococcus oceani C-27]ABA59317.1 Cation efflux protein [Nitrosococcus oceani ATCC 19707]EDZ66675.1 cation efflux family protein [Nitrosococcus oceani AFC27]KFI21523.1 ferrous iron transporter [Nitrosococcus oceani]GEM21143.1 iron transporter [Nitrosococcus oceani]
MKAQTENKLKKAIFPSETVLISRDHARITQRATYAAVSVAVILVVIKLGAYLVTGSVAMLSALIDSALDVAASLINVFAVRTALTPADREHRFGHGKAEPLAGLGQAAFITGSALFLAVESIRLLWVPQPVENGALGIGVMGVSTMLTLALVYYQRGVIRKTGSLAISADSLHYTGDVLVNLGVIAAIGLSTLGGWTLADPLFALGIAAYILWTAWQIIFRSLDQLMDRELPEEKRAQITQLALSHPEVLDFHDLRTRAAGQNIFIQFHLGVDGQLSLYRAHRIGKEVEAKVLNIFPQAEIIIHQDPIDKDKEDSLG